MIKTTWTNDLPLKYCEHLNTRVIGEDGVSPSKTFEGGGAVMLAPPTVNVMLFQQKITSNIY